MGMGQVVDYSEFILQIEKAFANGVATLDSSAKIPKNQIDLMASDVGAQPLGNELTALQSLTDTTGFLRKTGNGTYSVDVNSYLNLTGGTVSGQTTFSNTTASTSTTTGGVVFGGGVGVGGALFAANLNGNGSGVTSINASNISSGSMPYTRVNSTELSLINNDGSPALGTICQMSASLNDGYITTGYLLSGVLSAIRGVQILSNPITPEITYIRSRHSTFANGWSPWKKILIENDAGNVSVSGSVTGGSLRISALNVAPATAASAGILGEIRIDANHIYVCTATNTWKRVAIATW